MNETANIFEVLWFLVCTLGAIPGFVLTKLARSDAKNVAKNPMYLAAEEQYLARSAAVSLGATGLLIVGTLVPFIFLGIWSMFQAPVNPNRAPSAGTYVLTLVLFLGVSVMAAAASFLLNTRADVNGYVRGLIDGRRDRGSE